MLRITTHFRNRTTVHALENDRGVLGRTSREGPVDVDLRPDLAASRHHARIWREDEAVWIEDLGSRHGTFVNHERLDEGDRRKLTNEDLVLVGETSLHLGPEHDPHVPDHLPGELSLNVVTQKDAETFPSSLWLHEPGSQLGAALSRLAMMPVEISDSAHVQDVTNRVARCLCATITTAEESCVLLEDLDELEDGAGLQFALTARCGPGDSFISASMARRCLQDMQAIVWSSTGSDENRPPEVTTAPSAETRPDSWGNGFFSFSLSGAKREQPEPQPEPEPEPEPAPAPDTPDTPDTPDADAVPAPEDDAPEGISILVTPIPAGGTHTGVLAVRNTHCADAFGDEEIELLCAAAHYTGVAITHLKRRNDLQLQNNTMRRLLGRFPPNVHDALARRAGRGRLQPRARNTNVCLLCIRMCGLGDWSRALVTAAVAEMTNTYLSLVTDTIRKGQGTVLSWSEDIVLAIFGSPETDENQHLRALYVADRIQRGVTVLNDIRGKSDRPITEIAIGAHRGDVLHGFFGSYDRLFFTAIGRAVDQARTIAAETAPGEVLMTADFVEAVAYCVDSEQMRLKTPSGEVTTVYRLISAEIEADTGEVDVPRQRGQSLSSTRDPIT